jgi:flagellar basal body rod protein FlgC
MEEEASDTTPSRPDAEGDAHARWEAERTTFQRVYDIVTGVTEYASASEIAERAACSDDGARDALTQLVEMGIVEKRDSRPVEYRRNEAYFRWKRIEELASEHSTAALRSQIDALVEEDKSFQERFNAPDPDAISPTAFETTDYDDIHDRWEALSRWRSVRHDIEVLQQAAHRAEQQQENDASDTASA